MGIRRMALVPWKETCPMEQRLKFIADWLRDEWTMRELATRYQVSRKTAYKWVARYTADPNTNLTEPSRAPHAHGRACPDALRGPCWPSGGGIPPGGPRSPRDLAGAQSDGGLAGGDAGHVAEGRGAERAAAAMH